MKPQNSFQRIDVKRLKTIFKQYSGAFYPDHDYIIDQDNENVLEALFLLFAQDPDFVKQQTQNIVRNNISLIKGIYAFGQVGCGKTDFFEIMRKVAFHYYQMHRYRKLQFRIIHAGHFIIDYKSAVKNGQSGYFYEKHMGGRLLIDELGCEPQYYGQELLGQLILDRYRSWKRNRDLVTYITSNEPLSKIAERYGEKVADRLLEMCNVINWPGESRRHQ